ncbi:transcription initiation factor TFIID subunit 4-like [Amphibalanus amphitrite]|uniref:transcription initiation factor TFIID subunit 4-like n=1 Tax=Amphibalanus amphitrite TaxID=1232801 RepID=UPI001C91A25C|nr:transcription initiation factor TFIID subunit 4-like [Amphibalanus amphitrite]
MAAGGSLDDLLNSKVDERAFSALVGTLEDQLYSGQAQGTVTTTASGVIPRNNAAPVVSLSSAVPADGRVPANGAQHVVSTPQSDSKPVSLNVPRSVAVSSAGPRSASVLSQAGVIQTAHFPASGLSTAAGAGNAPGAVNNASAMKIVQTAVTQASASASRTYTINSTSLPNGSTSSAQSVITNGKQSMTVGNKVVNVAQTSSAPTVITVNRPANVAAQGVPVATNPSVASGVQILNVSQTRTQTPGVQGQKTLAPRVLLSPQVVNRAAQPGQPITLQTLQSLQGSGSGHLLVKTENGQLKLIQLPVQGANTSTAVCFVGTATTSTPNMYKSVAVSSAAGGGGVSAAAPQQRPAPAPRHPHAPHGHQLPTIYKSPVQAAATPRSATAVAVTAAASPAPAAAPAQTAAQSTAQPQGAMAPDTAKQKCRNFLATLLRLAKDQPDSVARNVRMLIQSLIDGRTEPETFTTRLQQELNSSPQPCLVPFLKKSLPFLRQSLFSREITIEGVKPPPSSALSAAPVAGAVPVMQVQRPAAAAARPSGAAAAGRTVTAAVSATGAAGSAAGHQVRLVTGAGAQPRNVSAGHPALLGIQPSATKVVRSPAVTAASAASPAAVGTVSGITVNRQPTPSAVRQNKKLNFKSSTFESGQDDDINDVAAMGGVNLQEESQHILDGTEYVGTQIRSVKDETFLPSAALQLKIRRIAMRHGLEEPGADVVALVSHATQERLKTLLEQVAIIAEHRMEVVKSEPGYDVSRDVRGQLRFLEELDKLEQKRHEETEREMLLRAAKSRSKTEDPEQAKLKAKAKEMQRVEMEEVRQREANITALMAIGPRKKPRLEGDAPAADGATVTGQLSQRQIPVRPRVKRVNIRDLLFVLEQERGLQRSERLYQLLHK